MAMARTFPPITAEQKSIADSIFADGNLREENSNDYCLKDEDIKSLRPGYKMTPDAVDAFMKASNARSQLRLPGIKNGYAFPVDLMRKIVQPDYNHREVRRYSKKAAGGNLASFRYLFFPEQFRIHYKVFVVDTHEHTITCRNSAYANTRGQQKSESSGLKQMDAIARYLDEAYAAKFSRPWGISWRRIPCGVGGEENERQLNVTDCGVFVCMIVDATCADISTSFTQADITAVGRYRVALGIHYQCALSTIVDNDTERGAGHQVEAIAEYMVS